MIDFHSHIIYGVDDGANTIENSIEILKSAKIAGFNSIILTPHYMENYYEYHTNEIENRVYELKNICKKENIDINLYQANEVYITNNMIKLIEEGKISTINQTRYVLFELPMNEEPQNLLEVIYLLKEKNITPIIAHPERYRYIQKNPNRLIELIDMGVLFQANYGSIIGRYGRECKTTVKLLIKNNFIHFLGTDVHKTTNIYSKISEIRKELKKLITERQIEELVQENAEKILNNESIEIKDPNMIKKNILEKIFS